jgi:hypothetical protein
VAFFILGICVAEGLISTSVVEQLVKPDGWSRASRLASSTVSSGLSATWFPLRIRRPDVPLVCRRLRQGVAPLCRAGLDTLCLSLSGGICRDHHDVGHVGMQYLTAIHQLAAAGSLKNTHPGSAVLAATTAAFLPRPCCNLVINRQYLRTLFYQ